jgi:XTP/dITP diphosphohydrolase
LRAFFVSGNRGKVAEVGQILAGSGLEVTARPIWLGEVETGLTYLENARLKALAGMRLTGMPSLAEDAGIEVDALNGAPGPRSARFAGPAADDDANNGKLLRLLSGVPEQRRTARYRAVCVLALPGGAEVAGEGVFEGRIAPFPRGDGGFGYDPLFFPAGETRTVGEMDALEKNAISHRARALRSLISQAGRDGLL